MTVELIFVDAIDRSQLPGNDLNINDMKEHGKYHDNFLMSDAVRFNSVIKMNLTFGKLFAKDWYMYTISRNFSRDVLPTAFHKHNFPFRNAIVAICRGKMLIILPLCRSPEEKKNQCYITTDGGAIVIQDSSDESVHSTPCVK